MKTCLFFLLFLIFILTTHPVFAADKKFSAEDCYKSNLTQLELNLCSKQDANKAREELDKELSAIKSRISDAPEKIKKLEEAQKAWEADMHAQLDFLYFDHDGSAAPMCINSEATRLIQERIDQLKRWADIKEDVCSGGLYRR